MANAFVTAKQTFNEALLMQILVFIMLLKQDFSTVLLHCLEKQQKQNTLRKPCVVDPVKNINSSFLKIIQQKCAKPLEF